LFVDSFGAPPAWLLPKGKPWMLPRFLTTFLSTSKGNMGFP
jgi:hypothetical protein